MNVFSKSFKQVQEESKQKLNHPPNQPPRVSNPNVPGGGAANVHRNFLLPRKDLQSLLQSSSALVPPKRSNKKEELNEVEIEDIPKIYFEEGKDSEHLAVRYMLGNLPVELNAEELQNQIIGQDVMRRRVQYALVETIMKNYQGFVLGVQHLSSTETDLAWSYTYLVQGRKTL